MVDRAKMAGLTQAIGLLVTQSLDVDRSVFCRQVIPGDPDFQMLVFRLLMDLDRELRCRQNPERLTGTIEQADCSVLQGF